MKKLTLFLVALLCAGGAFAASYGILVNGKTYFAGTLNSSTLAPSYTEYMALGVPLKAGDYLQLYDKEKSTGWAVDLDGASVSGITRSGSQYTCSAAGCYNFYIKLKYGDDKLYVGAATGDCSNNKGEDISGGDSGDSGDSGDGGDGGDSGDSGDGDSGDSDDSGEYKPGTYSSSVPSQCTDVMFQAFYWDSNSDKKHGNTKWTTLLAQAPEIAAYFDLIWLPPSAKSSGGVGYLPSQYSNQNSAWGTRSELETLIDALHTGGAKVIADIVVNHANNKSTWCDYYPLDFSPYGTFTPDASWICKTDEVNSSASGACKGTATGAADDGYGHEANYAAARDWDHNGTKVREMCRAYLKWMKYEMKYDGWRYDYCKGFHGSHVNDYNSAAQNYFSVTEYWDGNQSVLQSYLNDAGWNTLTFDFATKYDAFNNSLSSGSFAGCKAPGLLGAGKSKYAVTFIDNHDTYQRDNNEFGGLGNSMTSAMKDKVLQANAFILSMPGIPCVFYPHWKEYKSAIAPMVLARKAVQVHSESAVSDEGNSSGYRATVTGKNGTLILELGDKVSSSKSGYTKAASGTGYAMWIKTNSAVAPKLVVTPGTSTFKTSTLSISMSVIGGTESATIYYTLDGSDPTVSSTRKTYSAAFTISGTTTLKAYAKTASTKTDVQIYEYTYKAPQTTPITVSFYKPSSWDKVYLYAWTVSGTKTTNLMGTWPGTELTNVNADGFYYHTFDASIKEVNFIFNAGKDKDQTSDLWTDEDVCYMWSGGAEKLLTDCKVTAIDHVWADRAEMISLYPNPVRGTLHITSDETITRVEIYTCTGMLIETIDTRSSSNTIDVNDLQQGLYLLQATFGNGQKTLGKFVKQ